MLEEALEKRNNFAMKYIALFILLTSLSAFAETPITDYKDPVLNFYSVKAPYGEFSNFYLFPVTIDGVIWPTSEHYYQAHKYSDPELMEKVRAAPSPMAAAIMGRDPNISKRPDWDNYKDVAMETAVRAKFAQNEYLSLLLKHTNQAVIHEHTKNDCYWGDCGDGTGKDKLGILLMKIRSELD